MRDSFRSLPELQARGLLRKAVLGRRERVRTFRVRYGQDESRGSKDHLGAAHHGPRHTTAPTLPPLDVYRPHELYSEAK